MAAQNTTTRAPTRKATIVRRWPAGSRVLLPRCPSGPERSSLAGPTRSKPADLGGNKLEPPGVYLDGLGAGGHRVRRSRAGGPGSRPGQPGDGDGGADQQDLVEGGREGCAGSPSIRAGSQVPRTAMPGRYRPGGKVLLTPGHAAAGSRDHAQGGIRHGRVGQPDPDPQDEQAGQHSRPGGDDASSPAWPAARPRLAAARPAGRARTAAGRRRSGRQAPTPPAPPGQRQRLEPRPRSGEVPAPSSGNRVGVQERAEGGGGYRLTTTDAVKVGMANRPRSSMGSRARSARPPRRRPAAAPPRPRWPG